MPHEKRTTGLEGTVQKRPGSGEEPHAGGKFGEGPRNEEFREAEPPIIKPLIITIFNPISIFF